MGPGEPINPYQPPRAAAEPVATGRLTPSLEDAVAGRYQFTIGEVMSEAWQLTKGMKASIWGALIVVGLIYAVVDGVIGYVVGKLLGLDEDSNWRHAISGVVSVAMTPVTVGAQMLCIRRVLGLPATFASTLAYFHRGVPVLVGAVLVALLSYVGLALLIIPGIYLTVAYQLAIPLICERELAPWQAMETSRRAINHRWWGVFGLMIVVALLTAVSALALLIPLIWTIPWAMMATAVLYRRIFYARPAADAAAVPA